MKTKQKNFKLIGILIIATLLSGIAAASTSGYVSAMSKADDTPPPQTTPDTDKPLLPEEMSEKARELLLTKALNREKSNHEKFENILVKADQAENRISKLIARARENGKDTEDLDQAVAEFNRQLADARLAYDRAGNLIRRHEGFDDSFKVTDMEQAKDTVEEIREVNREVRQILTRAMKTLRDAGEVFREENPRPSTQPANVPA